MPYLVSATGHARRQLETARRWWLANRDKAPDLFVNELEAAQLLLADDPRLGTAFPTPRYPGARRLLMRKTRYHLSHGPRRRGDRADSSGMARVAGTGASAAVRGNVLDAMDSPNRSPFAAASRATEVMILKILRHLDRAALGAELNLFTVVRSGQAGCPRQRWITCSPPLGPHVARGGRRGCSLS